MSGPFIFVGTHGVRPHKLEDYRKTYLPDLISTIEEREPRLHAFHAFLSEDGSEVTGFQLHPDGDSMEFHMRAVRDEIGKAYEYLAGTTRIDMYGVPTSAAESMASQLAGVPVGILRTHLGGFVRVNGVHAPPGPPLIFIGVHRVREGKLELFRRNLRELNDIVESQEPRLLAFNSYLDEETGTVAVVQVHPDAASMLFHMGVAREHIEGAVEDLLENVRIEIYGTPDEEVIEMVQHLAQTGVPLSVKPVHGGGFTRLRGS